MVHVSCVTVILVPLIVLMLWMDVALFVKVQHIPPGHDNTKDIVEPAQESTSYVHSAFERLTMKLLVRSLNENSSTKMKYNVFSRLESLSISKKT
jgi:hypothetical protein